MTWITWSLSPISISISFRKSRLLSQVFIPQFGYSTIPLWFMLICVVESFIQLSNEVKAWQNIVSLK
jgi:hypothetical protein